MLAQNLKTPRQLHITSREFNALLTVLRMLERGEIPEDHFNMGVEWLNAGAFAECGGIKISCGTTGCILGWAKFEAEDKRLFARTLDYSEGLYDLFYGNLRHETTTSQAAIALRNYLTHGEPKWAEAMEL